MNSLLRHTIHETSLLRIIHVFEVSSPPAICYVIVRFSKFTFFIICLQKFNCLFMILGNCLSSPIFSLELAYRFGPFYQQSLLACRTIFLSIRVPLTGRKQLNIHYHIGDKQHSCLTICYLF